MKKMLLIIAVVWVNQSLLYAAQTDLLSDTWVATDSLGRSLPDYSVAGAPKTNRTVGIFYFLWLGQHTTTGPYDITQLLAVNPTRPAWGPQWNFHHWGQSELGYYNSTDPYVIRRHVSMLTDASVDVLILDVTNGFTYENVYLQLCSIMRQMRNEGNITPSICFIANTDAVNTVKTLYDNFYAVNSYSELWFYWKGKPLILTPLSGHSTAVTNFFTMRYCWAWTGGKDTWNWLADYPQGYGWHDSSTQVEETSVCVAQHPITNIGRSFHNGVEPPHNSYGLTGNEQSGLCFTEQWTRALSLKPEFLFITGWNEWVAQRFIYGVDAGLGDYFLGQPAVYGQSMFVDAYNQEYSRDIEPMKGGHNDAYYYQMVGNVRKYKGVRQLSFSEAKAIQIDANFSDWDAITPIYYDMIGDVVHRDWPGWGGSLHYINNTGRNDIIKSKVAFDAYKIYFYVETAQQISPYTDPNWMLMFIDSDQDASTGWNGYDYRINGKINPYTTSLESYTQSTGWNKVTNFPYKLVGSKMEMSIARSLIGQNKSSKIAFDFHWEDNMQHTYDINEFFINGDSAPNRRFNYRYEKATCDFFFDTPGDFDGWLLYNSLSSGIVSNGILSCDITDSDPYMIYDPALNLPAASYRYLHIIMRNGSSATNAEFYWATASSPEYGEDKVIRFATVPNDTVLREYWVNLQSHPMWTGTITSIRLDPSCASSGHIDIDQVRIQDCQPTCGDNGYSIGDITGPGGIPDCCIDYYDLNVLTASWLQSAAFTDPSNISDEKINFYDFAFLARQWLMCNY